MVRTPERDLRSRVASETASGWQQANLSNPVTIAAMTTYVISYRAPVGNYAFDRNYSWSTLSAAPLHVSGSSPGVYAYSYSAVFPSQTWYSSNYWVDVVFISGSPPISYNISGQVSGSAATLTLSGTSRGSTTTDATGRYNFSGLINGSTCVADPSQPGYSFTPSTSLVNISGGSVSGVNFSASVLPVPIPHSVALTWTASTSRILLDIMLWLEYPRAALTPG